MLTLETIKKAHNALDRDWSDGWSMPGIQLEAYDVTPNDIAVALKLLITIVETNKLIIDLKE